MTLTIAVHKRFWQAMGEHFGKRWLDEYGGEPTKSWRDALNKFSDEDIRGAIVLMRSKGWVHPPTLSQFEPLLRESARKRSSAQSQDWARGYWRSQIVREASDEATRKNLISNPLGFEDFLIRNKSTLGPPLLELLNEIQALESSTGQRTEGMHDHVMRRSREIVSSWRPWVEEDRKTQAAGGDR